MEKSQIILADDHAVVRAGIRKVIDEIPGVEVIAEVENGNDLIPVLAKHKPHCLLIDVAMPDFNPIVSIQQIRQSFPDLKILVVSAYDDDIYVQGMLGAGVNGYHLKDQPLSDLQLAVQRVLAGERWLSSPLILRLVRSTETAVPWHGLTSRQQELLRLLQEGCDNQAIAQKTGLSIKTVENHLTRLYRHLRVQSRLEAVNYVLQHPEILGVSGEEIAQPRSLEAGNPKSINVLLVDDNSNYRFQMQRMIAKVCTRAVVFEAKDIAMALHLAQKLNPQLAMVDVVLGEEDGIRCARRIKAISPHTRIILISAYPDREFHRLGLEAGAVAFLDKKDLDAPTLRQVFSDMLD